jgi:hypothetical protein
MVDRGGKQSSPWILEGKEKDGAPEYSPRTMGDNYFSAGRPQLRRHPSPMSKSAPAGDLRVLEQVKTTLLREKFYRSSISQNDPKSYPSFV